jgi:hypothetical protein
MALDLRHFGRVTGFNQIVVKVLTGTRPVTLIGKTRQSDRDQGG